MFRFENYQKVKKTPAKLNFREMKIGDLLIFNNFGIKQRRRILDFDDELNPIINMIGIRTSVLPRDFIKFERRFDNGKD